LKLIHAGKVLKDDDVLSAVGVKENDFLVAMLTKAKKVVAAAPKTPAPPPKEEAAPAAAAAATPAPTATPAPSTAATTTPAAPVQAPAASDEVVNNLVTMGFPEESVRHCLRVAQGNPDLAVEFLTNGIPEGMEQALASAGETPAAATGSTRGGPLQALRNHPQFNDLRRLVQSNPQMLQQVLTQIGQQQPELLTEINANQALFLQMMNEPIEGGAAATAGAQSSRPPSSSSGSSAAPENPFGGGMGNPMQMAQMIQGMNNEELTQMAQMMGVSTEQLRATAQMIGQMPPEQLNQFIMQAMGGGGGGMEGMFGGGGADGPGGGGPGGPQVLRLTDDEMAAVDRLTEMGFDRGEAAQAFLACDKNEALAANLLMDSMMGDDSGGGGGGSGSGGSGGNDASGGAGGGAGGDDDEDMYD
jgi:UV excision repair protein RAD23